MRIRSGHNPEDWIDCPPANPGSSPIRGSLVQGAPGPVAQRRLTRNQTRKDEREVAAGRPRLSPDVTPIGHGGRPGYASEEERLAARRLAWRESKRRAREQAA